MQAGQFELLAARDRHLIRANESDLPKQPGVESEVGEFLRLHEEG